MSGNAKFRWFFLAPIAVALLVVASPASAKDDLIADVYFDDGSVLHDAKFTPKDSLESSIKVKHENEFFHLDFKDLKTIEFDVKPINNNIRIKIKTKIGVVINDSFSMPAEPLHQTQRAIGYYLCKPRWFKFKSKVTGKEISHQYEITNLEEGSYKCRYKKHETKAISSIVFKDGIEKKTEKKLTQPTNVPPLLAAQMLSDLPEKTTREKNKLSSEEELAKKMTNYYKNASDQEIDKFIIGLTNAKKKVLPQKLNKAITLYKVEYIKDGNVVGYAYEVNADNLGLTEKELVAGKQNLTYSLREHHKRYFCTSPTIRMELDIGIDFFINIISENSNNLGSYQISKGDCIN